MAVLGLLITDALANQSLDDRRVDPTHPLMPRSMYPTRDRSRILLMNIYPALKTKALAFFGCNDDPKAIGEAVRKWDAFALEDAMNRAGLQETVVRSPAEFLAEEQGQCVERMPPIAIEETPGGAPEPVTPHT